MQHELLKGSLIASPTHQPQATLSQYPIVRDILGSALDDAVAGAIGELLGAFERGLQTAAWSLVLQLLDCTVPGGSHAAGVVAQLRESGFCALYPRHSAARLHALARAHVLQSLRNTFGMLSSVIGDKVSTWADVAMSTFCERWLCDAAAETAFRLDQRSRVNRERIRATERRVEVRMAATRESIAALCAPGPA